MKRDYTIVGRSQGETTEGKVQDVILGKGIYELTSEILRAEDLIVI